ncbi:CDP-diacylglycerol--glycerol-3-phosphate 3-phosphatidyltransferase [Actinomyces vulturis]|uniref:CDP-diacylglycerol--glycerol-3-phosphate 3-phosphatidyltransferase n=1 Tax=Actinomyces vulturis TaxID=1857645 RepID=UPI000B5AF505|nr:CDP-diacylglycerol--glycerol-3-phosphate 3-phosphatidyltransferase [Actinomyces vulturis]
MMNNSVPRSQPQAPVLNIANVLTVARIIMVPFFIAYALQDTDRGMLIATVIFLVASWTDNLDGYLARSRNLITNFGKIADPIADKALTLSAFILLSVNGRLWWWVTIIILVRELGITLMRMVLIRKAVMAASRGGKIKTTLQMTGLVGLLTPWSMFLPDSVAHWLVVISDGIIGAALVVTVVTGIDYIKSAWQMSRAA